MTALSTDDIVSNGTADDAADAAAALVDLKVAVVHDFLYTYAGAERVLEQTLEVFPQADVFSLFDFVPDADRAFLKGKKVTTSFLQKMPFSRTKHRAYLALMPLAIEQLDVSAYDLVISSSYLSAKGVITAPHQLHVCYCHSPVRFAWDQQHQYLAQTKLTSGLRGLMAKSILHYIRSWDVRSANGVDAFLTNSHFVRQRVAKTYRRDATTIHPPVDVDRFPACDTKEDFYVTASRLVPYKRIDLIVEAFNAMPSRKLVVVGDGPERKRIEKLAGPNVTLLGQQPHAVLCDHLQRARGFVFAAEEDFGIAPVEAQACGTPVIAFGRGGITETVIPGRTGLFFSHQTAASIRGAIEHFEQRQWDYRYIRQHAESFSPTIFRQKLVAYLAGKWATFAEERDAHLFRTEEPHPSKPLRSVADIDRAAASENPKPPTKGKNVG